MDDQILKGTGKTLDNIIAKAAGKNVGKHLASLSIYLFLALGAFFTLLPFAWMVLTSLKSPAEIMVMPPRWFPEVWQFGNYSRAMAATPFGQYFLNTVAVTTAGTLLTVLTSILAAYGFSRLRFPGQGFIFMILMATLMIPGEMLIITNYITIARLNWMDSRMALIVPWIANVFYIYLLRQFFLQMPDSLYYAAKVDGCSDWKFLWRVVVPNHRHAIATVAILNAINSWNAFLWPLIVTNTESKRVLSIGLIRFQTEAGTQYELLMAASALLVIPMVVLYLVLRKHIMNSVTSSGIKG